MNLPYRVQDIHAIQSRYFRARDALRKARKAATKAKREAEIADRMFSRTLDRFEKAEGELQELGVRPDRRAFSQDPARPGWTILEIADEETDHQAQKVQAQVHQIRKAEDATEARAVALTRDEARARITAHRSITPGVRSVSNLRCNG